MDNLQEIKDSLVVRKQPLPQPQQDIKQDLPQVLLDIKEFKEDAVAWAKQTLAIDKGRPHPILEIKEVKDLTDIITKVESTFIEQKDSTTTTVNILVQNLIEGHKDDC